MPAGGVAALRISSTCRGRLIVGSEERRGGQGGDAERGRAETGSLGWAVRAENMQRACVDVAAPPVACTHTTPHVAAYADATEATCRTGHSSPQRHRKHCLEKGETICSCSSPPPPVPWSGVALDLQRCALTMMNRMGRSPGLRALWSGEVRGPWGSAGGRLFGAPIRGLQRRRRRRPLGAVGPRRPAPRGRGAGAHRRASCLRAV